MNRSLQSRTPTTQDNYVERLRGDEVVQATALEELRVLLSDRLTYTFRNSTVVDSWFVEDVVQESLMKILEALDQFNGMSKFTTWATTIAIRLAFTELRRKRWKDRSLDSMMSSSNEIELQTENDPAANLATTGFLEALRQAIMLQLTERQRTALLFELDGVPQITIGQQLGITRNAVYKLTHDARKRLRRELEALGYSAEDLARIKESCDGDIK